MVELGAGVERLGRGLASKKCRFGFSELWSSLTQSVCTATSAVRAQQKHLL